MKAIGGYLDLQLNVFPEHHYDLIRLNTGRNALEYILKLRRYKMIHLPYFSPEGLMEPIKKLKIAYQFYTIDEHLDPVPDFNVGAQECMLYINYFGIKERTAQKLSRTYPNVILDNSQAFFANHLPGIDAFYNCRKFFGVPDGAYVYTESPLRLKMEKDHSYERFGHLLKSIDVGTERAYADFLRNEQALSNCPLRKMSALTQRMMGSIDYDRCNFRRNSNFIFLHEYLEGVNDYQLDSPVINGPMVYPLVIKNSAIRETLIANKVYIASYWPNVLRWTTKKMYEHYLSTNLVALPIDHRYNLADMKRIIQLIKTCL
jgi:hypothetical protein